MRRRVWVIRGGDDNRLVDLFVGRGLIAVGYPDVPDGRFIDQYDVTERLRARGWTVPERRAEMYAQFVHQVQPGHFVVMPDTPRGQVVIGRVEGAYEHGEVLDDEEGYRHQRRVTWLARHARNLLPAAAQDLTRQRSTIAEASSGALLEHCEAVERGEVGRDPLLVEEPRAPQVRSARPSSSSPRSRPAATPKPRSPAPPATKVCTSCFLAKSPDLFPGGGDTCVDCT